MPATGLDMNTLGLQCNVESRCFFRGKSAVVSFVGLYMTKQKTKLHITFNCNKIVKTHTRKYN